MSNQTRRKKRIRNGVLIALAALLVISYVVSQRGKKVDPVALESVEVSEPTAHVKGNPESGITLVEYSDFQCPACAVAAPQIDSLVADFGDQFQLEFKHFPLRSIHPNAQLAGQAAEAAGMQGKFWEMHDKLFETQTEWSSSINPKRHFKNYAEELGLNVDRFEFDLESDKVKEVVNTHFDEAGTLELPGAPSFVFEGERIDINTFITEQLVPASEVASE